MEKNFPKILLVNPPSEFRMPVLPLGLASIAAYLKSKEKDIDISIIDAWAENLSFDEIEKKVAQSQADIIGVYMISPRYNKAKATIEICRRARQNSLIIAGGPHASAVPGETLEDIPQLDICAIGEGEITMYELIKGLPLATVEGIAYRDGKEIKITKPRENIKNLDDLPLPARELFDLKKYHSPPPYGRKNPYFIMVTARGCPFQCTYCSRNVFKNVFRARSPKKVCDEIAELVSKYHAREIQFLDDDFSLDVQRAEQICDEILKRGIKISWSCSTRVDLINENLLKKMKKAGCWLINYGVESGNQKILDGVNKGFTVEQVISAFRATKKAGMSTICSFIVGLPGETKETIQDTANLIKKIKPDFISGGALIVYPGSRLFQLIQQGKYLGKLKTLKNEEKMPGVYFSGNYTVFEDNLSFRELSEGVKKLEREFYLRPKYILQSLMKIRSVTDLNYYLKAGLAVIKSFIK